MSGSTDSIISKRLWNMARNNRGQSGTISDTGLRYPYKPVQRRRFSSIEYLRSVTGSNELAGNLTNLNYNERLVDDERRRPVSCITSGSYLPLPPPPPGSHINEEVTMFPITGKSAPRVRDVSACIRLGSMYSSAGYGWKDEEGNFAHHILNDWPDCTHCPEKDKRRTLSDILLTTKPKEEIVAFGYDAHKIYINSTSRQRKKFIYLTNFSKLFSRNLADSVSDGCSSMELNMRHVFVAVVQHFRQAILAHIRYTKGMQVVGKIGWTIIVDDDRGRNNIDAILPDIPMANGRVVLLCNTIASYICSLGENKDEERKPKAKDSMQRYKSIASVNTINHSSDLSIRKNPASFILLNVGATSTEITLFSINANTIQPKCTKKGDFGGQTVSDGFYKFLGTMFGEKLLQLYRKENYEGYVDILCNIEKGKRSVRRKESLAMHLPFSFSQHFQKKSGRNSRLTDNAHRMDCQFNSASNCVVLEHGHISGIFLFVINRITALLEEVVKEEEVVDGVYLTGGFGQSSLFQETLQETFPVLNFIQVEDPVFLQLIGGMQQGCFRTLQSRYTIGVTAAAHCDRDTLQSSLSKAILCDAFVPFVKKDEYLTGHDHHSVHSFFAASPNQESILIRVVFMDKDAVGNVSEEAMHCMSQLQLHVPLEKRGVLTGKLFVFKVILRFIQQPEGITVTVKDVDGIVYGCCRIIRSVTY